jgi:hypothetical protein
MRRRRPGICPSRGGRGCEVADYYDDPRYESYPAIVINWWSASSKGSYRLGGASNAVGFRCAEDLG